GDRVHLALESQGTTAISAQPTEQPQRYEPAERSGSQATTAREEASGERAGPRRIEQPAAHADRQGVGQFLDARMHELGHADDLARLRSHFAAHASESARARLQIR